MNTIDTIRTPPRAPMPSGHGRRDDAVIASPLSVIRMLRAVYQWRVARWRSRRSLENLDDHLLRDIGLTHEAAAREARRSFWD